jgi:hypothetical protein
LNLALIKSGNNLGYFNATRFHRKSSCLFAGDIVALPTTTFVSATMHFTYRSWAVRLLIIAIGGLSSVSGDGLDSNVPIDLPPLTRLLADPCFKELFIQLNGPRGTTEAGARSKPDAGLCQLYCLEENEAIMISFF